MATPTVREALSANNSAGTVTVTTGSGTQVGDLLIAIHEIVFRASSDLATPGGTAGTWTEIGTAQVSGGSYVKVRAWRRAVTTAGAQTVSITPPSGVSQTNQLIVLVLAGADTTSPIDGGTVATASGNTGTAHAVGAISPTSSDALLVGAWGAYGTGVGSSPGYTAPSGMTERRENNSSANNAVMAATQALSASGSTGSRTATSAAAVATQGWAGVLFAVKGASAGATAPTVDAGADVASHTVDTSFARTATENDGGATITGRAWTIQSGPAGVGNTIGTAAALSWTPTATGTYVLRYSATNSAGTGTDDVQVTVAAAPAAAPGSVFPLARWHLTLPTEDPGPDTDAAQIDQPELATYTDANFYLESGPRMVCVAPVVGATTSGASGATRAELREHEAGSYANSAWDPATTGRRQLTVTTYVDATSITGGSTPRKEAIIGQIHGAGDSPIPLILAAEYHVTPARIRIFKNGPGLANIVTDITPDTPITYRIRCENARLKLWAVAGQVADLAPLSAPQYDWPISDFTDVEGWYFKCGIYNKTTIASGSSGQAVARISHLELLQPGDPDPVAPAVESGRMLLSVA